MGFCKMLELLQEKHKGSMILINNGSFYIAKGKDAVLLYQMLGLKLSCIEPEVCKVGFPLNSLEKYTKLIEEKKYSYVVYHYDNIASELSIIKKYQGKHNNKRVEEKENCIVCTSGTKMYKKNDKYLQALANLYEKEKEKKEIEKKKEEQENG